MKILLPENVRKLIQCLKDNNYEAYVVGGCVRDSIMGSVPHDWDICTNAKPNEIKKCFESLKTFDNGIKHGTISVIIDNEIFEITTYRIDGEYKDNRHPESVIFTDDITKDLSRRDFTVNAMAYNEEKGLIDPFNGKIDLENRIIRCVGDSNKRFIEDALRILRALRFASCYGFSIEKFTSSSIRKYACLLNNIAYERISEEFNKLLCGINSELILNEYNDVISVFIPEITSMFNYNQHTKHHCFDLWKHTTHSVGLIEPILILRMTMLLHDIGKPDACRIDSDGVGHFKGHPKHSSVKADVILHRLKYPTDFICKCITLIKYHDVRFNTTKRQLKHIMNTIGIENTEFLIKVQYADIMAQSDYKRFEKLQKLNFASELFKEILLNEECFTLKQLKINGNDLKNIGIRDGILIGKILKRLLNLVIEDKIENNKEALTIKAKILSKEV